DRARRRRAWGAEPATATVRTPSPAARPAWRRLRGPSPRALQLADARDGIDVAMHQLAVALLAGDTANPEQLDLAARRSRQSIGGLVHVGVEVEARVQGLLTLDAGAQGRPQYLDVHAHALIEIVAELEVLDAPRHRG